MISAGSCPTRIRARVIASRYRRFGRWLRIVYTTPASFGMLPTTTKKYSISIMFDVTRSFPRQNAIDIVPVHKKKLGKTETGFGM